MIWYTTAAFLVVLPTSDVAAMSGKLKPAMMEARSCMIAAKEWLASIQNQDQNILTSLRGQFEAERVQGVHKKQPIGRKRLTSEQTWQSQR